jgi:hypothetical protein
MSSYEIEQLDAMHSDLMSRATLMRNSGYIASADSLLQKAYACAQRRYSMSERALNPPDNCRDPRQPHHRPGVRHA